MDKIRCKRCGKSVFYTKFTGIQYYDKYGNPDGYEVNEFLDDSKMLYCCFCNKPVIRVATVKKLKELSENG